MMNRMVDPAVENIIKALEQTPDKAARLLGSLPVGDLKHRESDEFSALESICHLRDLEIEGYGERITRILQEDVPDLPDIDGARLALERNYNSQNPQTALEAFRSARRKNLDLVRSLNTEQLQRKAKLAGVGEINLEKLLELMLEHDEGHLAELTIISRRSHSQTSGTAAI